MLRIHFMQQWFGLSDPAMEEALHDVPMYQSFAHLDAGMGYISDESTILRFRHLLEEHKLAESMLATLNALLEEKGLLLKRGTVVDATIIAAPSSTKNSSGKRDPQMHQTKKGNQWHHGTKRAFDACEAQRYKKRTVAERMNARLKDEFGANRIYVRTHSKVMCHLMFGILALCADQIMRLLR